MGGGADNSSATRGGQVEVKLFVGRLPRTIDEATLTPLFSPFGRVMETVIIRDKASGVHKGSAFIKMASITEADAAVRALHNVKVLDPQFGPIQVKYANGEPERLGLSVDSAQAGQDLGKLFVGSVARNMTEQDVRQIFEPYGKIEEVVVLKDPGTKQSRGCAFVKFAYKEQALQAIKALHGVVTTPGSSRPLEVKFAENRRAAPATSSSALSSFPASGVMATAAVRGNGTSADLLSQQQQPPHSNLNPRSAGGWTEYFTADGRAYYHNAATNTTHWTKPPEFDRLASRLAASVPQAPGVATSHCASSVFGVPSGGQSSVLGSYAGSPNVSSLAGPDSSSASGGDGSGHTEIAGPPGANVFVFHIPNEWTQNDLIAHFSPFGPVVSCYIASDRVTGRNKGYGFVSYNNIHSAANAVLGMNGYLVGTKRLKVSIKTGEETYVAHLLRPSSGSAGGILGYHPTPSSSIVASPGHHLHSTRTAVSHHPVLASPETASALGALPLQGAAPAPAYFSHLYSRATAAHNHHHAAATNISPTDYGPATGSAGLAPLGAYRASPY